jgi:hypothetical protein
MVAFSDMYYVTSFGHHNSRRFMTQQCGKTVTRPWRPAHGVELRVTDAAGKELHQNLVRRGIRDIDCIYH